MPFMPFNFLFLWLVGLLSIGVLGGGIYIVYEYYIGELVGISYLVSGVLMVLWSVGGRFISLPLFRRPGADEPKPTRTGSVQRVERPDGTILQVEFYGPEHGQLVKPAPTQSKIQQIIHSPGWVLPTITANN